MYKRSVVRVIAHHAVLQTFARMECDEMDFVGALTRVSSALRERDGRDARTLEGRADLHLDELRAVDDRHVRPRETILVQLGEHLGEIGRLVTQARELEQSGLRPIALRSFFSKGPPCPGS